MLFDDQFWRALADYALRFPTVLSMGDGNPPETWYVEYQRVGRSAFAAVLITSSGGEGGNASGAKMFPQETLIDALHCRRFELDPTYALPAHLAQFAAEKIARSAGGRRGLTLRFCQ